MRVDDAVDPLDEIQLFCSAGFPTDRRGMGSGYKWKGLPVVAAGGRPREERRVAQDRHAARRQRCLGGPDLLAADGRQLKRASAKKGRGRCAGAARPTTATPEPLMRTMRERGETCAFARSSPERGRATWALAHATLSYVVCETYMCHPYDHGLVGERTMQRLLNPDQDEIEIEPARIEDHRHPPVGRSCSPQARPREPRCLRSASFLASRRRRWIHAASA